MVKLLLCSICFIPCASLPFLSIFQIVLSHFELTFTGYEDVVASAPTTILPVSNIDGTIIEYANASAVIFATFIEFSAVRAPFLCYGLYG